MSGLEAIGAAASIIQVADAGLRLAKTIYSYIETVSSAEKRLDRIGSHVQTTSQVVREIGQVFQHRETAKLVSIGAIKTACGAAKECEGVFEELREVIEKTRRRKWGMPFKEQKLELLGAQLEKLKSTLHCLMSVLIHARILKNNAAPKEKKAIAQLIREKNEATARYEELRRNHEFLLTHMGPTNKVIINHVQIETPIVPANRQASEFELCDAFGEKVLAQDENDRFTQAASSADSPLPLTHPDTGISMTQSLFYPSQAPMELDVSVADGSANLAAGDRAKVLAEDLELCIDRMKSLVGVIEAVQKALERDTTETALSKAEKDLQHNYIQVREDLDRLLLKDKVGELEGRSANGNAHIISARDRHSHLSGFEFEHMNGSEDLSMDMDFSLNVFGFNSSDIPPSGAMDLTRWEPASTTSPAAQLLPASAAIQYNQRRQKPLENQFPHHPSQPYQPYPHPSQRRQSTASIRPRKYRSTQASSRIEPDEANRERGVCPIPDCGRVFKDLKAHMLTHQQDRPQKCHIQTCQYHTKGFARKYDKHRHILTHYRGTMVCGFCPGSGSAAERSFQRADVFKRHLTSIHGVKQPPSNWRGKSPSSISKPVSTGRTRSAGKCSICSIHFANAQEFYEHLDDCMLRVVLQIDSEEVVSAFGASDPPSQADGKPVVHIGTAELSASKGSDRKPSSIETEESGETTLKDEGQALDQLLREWTTVYESGN